MSARAATSAGVAASAIRTSPRLGFEAERARFLLGHRPRFAQSKRRLQTTTSRPNAAARLMTSCAMLPMPSTPSVCPRRPLRLRVRLLVPLAGAQLGDVVGNAAIERQDQPEGQLGDGDRVLPGTIGDVDPARRRRGHVDRVVARAGADDEREPTRVEHRGGHLRAAHHEHVGAARAHGVDERVVLGLRLVHDVAAGGAQAVEAALLEAVGDQDFMGFVVRRSGSAFGSRAVDRSRARAPNAVRSDGPATHPSASVRTRSTWAA